MQIMSRLCVFLSVLIVFAAGCGIVPDKTSAGTVESVAPPEPERVVIPVEAQKPTRGDISEYLDTVARVEAEKRVEVASKGTGICLEVLAEEGDTVKKGQPLAELDKKDLEAQLRQTELKVRQARSDLERSKKAYEYGFLSGMEYENAKFALENAEAALQTQQIQLENATIRAPIDGVITRRSIHEGQLVSTGTPVFQIVDPNSYVINIEVAEKDLPRLKIGQTARFSVLSLEGKEFEARVSRINPGVDPTSGMVKVRLELDASTRAQLREAAFVRIRLVMDTHTNALLIPKDALLEENMRRYLFIVADSPVGGQAADASASANATSAAPRVESDGRMYARRVPVEVGLEDNKYAEIVSGIDDDTLVITVGQKNLKTDAEIRVTTAQAEMESSTQLTAEKALEAAKAKHEEIKLRQEAEKRETAKQLAEQRRRMAAGRNEQQQDETAESAPADDL